MTVLILYIMTVQWRNEKMKNRRNEKMGITKKRKNKGQKVEENIRYTYIANVWHIHHDFIGLSLDEFAAVRRSEVDFAGVCIGTIDDHVELRIGVEHLAQRERY